MVMRTGWIFEIYGLEQGHLPTENEGDANQSPNRRNDTCILLLEPEDEEFRGQFS